MKPYIRWLATLAFVAVAALPNGTHAQEGPDENAGHASGWQGLVMAEDLSGARSLCEGWLESGDRVHRIEAHKCLANVEMAEARSGVFIEGNDTGGGMLRQGFSASGVELALDHLDAAIELSPRDASVHQGRIFVLRASGRHAEIPAILEKSIKEYRGKDALDIWIGTLYPLFEERHYSTAIEAFRALERHFPDSPQVAANLGALYALTEKDELAKEYLEKSVRKAPDDPLNNWNLARFHDYAGDYASAEKYYQKSIGLETDDDKRRWLNCVFSEFVETKLKDMERACALRRANCPGDRQEGCGEKAP